MRIRTSRVPIGYRELEYIESTGTQYLDTGVKPTQNTRVKAKLFTKYAENKNWFGGSAITGESYVFNAWQNSNIEYNFGNTGWKTATTSVPVINNIFEVDFSKNGIYINGDSLGVTMPGTSFTSSLSLTLFIRKTGSAYIKGRFYYCIIYDSTTIVRNLIPCERMSDNKPGMYDTVNNVFYTNSGTGEFIKGPYKDSYNCPIFIEEGTTNLDPYKTTVPNFPYATLKEKVYFKGKWCWHIKVESNKTSWIGSYLSLVGYPENTVMTRSCLLYIPSGQPNTNGWYGLPFAFEGMNAITRKKVYDLSKKDTWQYCYCTGTAKNTSSNYLIYMIAANSGPVAIEFYITDIQFEQKDHPTPYTPDTRAANYVQCGSPKINLLPMEYQGVEYIQSTGTQLIDTGVNADSNLGVDIKVYEVSGRFGAYNENPVGRRHHSYSGSSGYGYDNKGAGSSYTLPILYRLKINYFKEKKLYFNDRVFDISSGEFNSQTNYGLFGRLGLYPQSWSGKVYYCILTYNDSIVRNFIPCYRKSDSVIGMYDTVNKQFYTNSGTGTFTKGPDKNYII